MSEVFVQFETIVTGPNGSRWTPRACGRARTDGLWESWIEFDSMSPSDGRLRTPRESLQPNRDDLMYWAQGLTQTYLEGALQRAVGSTRLATTSPTEPSAPRAVLNPFEVWEQGENVLVRQLSALSSAHLRDIAVAYGIATRQAVASEPGENLVAIILDGVRNRRAKHTSGERAD